MDKKSLCGLTADEIFNIIKPSGFKFSQAVSISNGIYKNRTNNKSEIPKIPQKLRNELNANACTGTFLPVASVTSEDRTIKYLFRTDLGKEYETVYIPESKRITVCVSTQSGCRMGCLICATAAYGFRGNLTAGEIVNQIISIPGAGKVTHVVLMGMGEPLDNLDNVLKACEIITAGWGLSISPRNVTVSTVGITPGIEKFLEYSDCNLTLSLHSPFPEERMGVVPVEKIYPVKRILEILKSYPVKKKRRLSLAYVMIKDLNDSERHLEEIQVLLKGSKVRVNLLPYHQIRNDLHTSSTEERMLYFKHNLVISGISASIRKSRGIEISAACGLLSTGLK